MFQNDTNRKTATQDGQNGQNPHQTLAGKRKRKMLLQPQNRTKTEQEIGKNRKTTQKIDK